MPNEHLAFAGCGINKTTYCKMWTILAAEWLRYIKWEHYCLLHELSMVGPTIGSKCAPVSHMRFLLWERNSKQYRSQITAVQLRKRLLTDEVKMKPWFFWWRPLVENSSRCNFLLILKWIPVTFAPCLWIFQINFVLWYHILVWLVILSKIF